MSYVEERLAEIRAAKASDKAKRPMSKLTYKIRFRVKARRRLEALQEKDSTAIELYGDDSVKKVRPSYGKSEQEWRDILERHLHNFQTTR